MILTSEYFNNLALDMFNNENYKWWHDQNGNFIYREDHVLKILIISELIEAMNGIRKDSFDEHLPNRKALEVELADAILRSLDRMQGLNLDKIVNDYRYYPLAGKDILQELYLLIKMISNDTPFERLSTETFIYSILDLGEEYNLDIIGALQEKRIYNMSRKDHSYEERNGVNGKKF